MHKQLLTLHSRILVPQAATTAKTVPAKHVRAFNLEIGVQGYTFDAKAIAALRALSPEVFATVRKDFLALTTEISGSSALHRTLFNKFPHETPDQDEYLMKRWIGFQQHDLRHNIESGLALSCGHVIDTALFDPKDFGICPICQFAVDELESNDLVLAEFKKLSPLKPIALADGAFLSKTAGAMLARPSSLSGDERAFLLSLRGTATPAVPASVTRENLPLVYAFHGIEEAKKHLSGATDVLRIAALLSDPAADLSLKAPVKFKLSTRDKKAMLRLLESLDQTTEDLLRHRERWLRLAERLNPGSAENRRKYPKTAGAFDTLRQDPKSIVTFNRQIEPKLRARSVDKKLIQLLTRRPGEFLRRLDWLLRNGGSRNVDVLEALPTVAGKATTKMLFELAKYLQHRKANTDRLAGFRTFLPKGEGNHMQVVKDTRGAIPAEGLDQAVALIDAVLHERLAELPKMGRVWIDPALKNIVMPYNRRGDSSTTSQVIKGSRYPMNRKADVVRLFVHWTGHIDVDLSMIAFDDQFRFIQQISWTNTQGYGCQHSGDVQNAPNGASEFIDFDIDTLIQRRVRYIAASVISFRGQTFDSFPCFAGFMERDALKSGKKYEPQSVALKFDLTAKATAYMPLVFDLETGHVIFTDVACGMGRAAAVQHQEDKQVALLRAAVQMTSAKPTVWDVLTRHAKARGQLAKSPETAKTAFTVETLDIEAVMALMAETE